LGKEQTMSELSNEEAFAIFQKMAYYSKEISLLIDKLSFKQLKQIQDECEKDSPEHLIKLTTEDPDLKRLGMLIQNFHKVLHCEVCTLVHMIAGAIWAKVESVKDQTLQ
jgi:hypothetical protein